MCVYICVNIYLPVCIYVYAYIYTHMYICISKDVQGRQGPPRKMRALKKDGTIDFTQIVCFAACVDLAILHWEPPKKSALRTFHGDSQHSESALRSGGVSQQTKKKETSTL